jgi:nicotinamidase-related amidase
MTNNAIIVVDMLKGFLDEGHPLYCGPEAREIVPDVLDFLEKEHDKGTTIIFVKDTHSENDPEFEIYPPHCVQGTEECKLIEELNSLIRSKDIHAFHVPKRTYSGFWESELDDVLKRAEAKRLTVLGVCTDICVMHTVADARKRGWKVDVPAKLCASFDRNNHEWALEHMQNVLGAEIV